MMFKNHPEDSKYSEDFEMGDLSKKENMIDQSSVGGMSTHSLGVTKNNIKMATVYDTENERFIICEKTYELQKYYVLQYDSARSEQGLPGIVQVIQYVDTQPNIHTRQIGRGKRGLEIDMKEFLALKNLVHFYSPNPFLGV